MAYSIPVDTVTDDEVTVQKTIDTFKVLSFSISEEYDALAISVALGNTVGEEFQQVSIKTLVVKDQSAVNYAMLNTTGGRYILDTRNLVKKIIDDFLAGAIPNSDTKLIAGRIQL
jgi:hypothetical protein